MPPAARIGDMHVCPMQTPGTPPIPHVGGPIIGPGVPTVLIAKMPAAVVGDMCTCVGPPATHRHGLDEGHDRQEARRPRGRQHGARGHDHRPRRADRDDQLAHLDKVQLTAGRRGP